MYLTQIISYGNAWESLVEEHAQELEELLSIITGIIPEAIEAARPLRDVSYQREPGVTRFRLDGLWATLAASHGWEESNLAIRGEGRRSILLRGLGFTKNRVSVTLARHREVLNRWLYTLAPIATRNDIIDIPIAVCLAQSAEENLFGRSPIGSSLERTRDELIALSPLSHGNPFLLMGISMEDHELEVTEIQSDDEFGSHQIIINRSIEFPPEYHQAGIGILSYFGTVLREKYPAHNAKVRIEQDGLRVRLIIESENGDKEIIEKALQQYELVVRGETPPEVFFDDKAKVLELKSELRIAHVRIEGQRDIIAYQGQEIASLRTLFGHALSASSSSPIAVSVNPAITVTSNSTSNVLQYVPIVSEHIQELADYASSDPDMQLRLLDLDDSMGALEHKKTPEAIRESGGMKKLKRFLDDAAESGSAVNTFLGKVVNGVETAQKLARRYNDIAEWCGAPQVPRLFLGKDE